MEVQRLDSKVGRVQIAAQPSHMFFFITVSDSEGLGQCLLLATEVLVATRSNW